MPDPLRKAPPRIVPGPPTGMYGFNETRKSKKQPAIAPIANPMEAMNVAGQRMRQAPAAPMGSIGQGISSTLQSVGSGLGGASRPNPVTADEVISGLANPATRSSANKRISGILGEPDIPTGADFQRFKSIRDAVAAYDDDESRANTHLVDMILQSIAGSPEARGASPTAMPERSAPVSTMTPPSDRIGQLGNMLRNYAQPVPQVTQDIVQGMGVPAGRMMGQVVSPGDLRASIERMAAQSRASDERMAQMRSGNVPTAQDPVLARVAAMEELGAQREAARQALLQRNLSTYRSMGQPPLGMSDLGNRTDAQSVMDVMGQRQARNALTPRQRLYVDTMSRSRDMDELPGRRDFPQLTPEQVKAMKAVQVGPANEASARAAMRERERNQEMKDIRALRWLRDNPRAARGPAVVDAMKRLQERAKVNTEGNEAIARLQEQERFFQDILNEAMKKEIDGSWWQSDRLAKARKMLEEIQGKIREAKSAGSQAGIPGLSIPPVRRPNTI